MSTKDALGPFQAGDGGLPPYLAGREYEQEICAAFLSRLRNGRPPPREIVFHGPRGIRTRSGPGRRRPSVIDAPNQSPDEAAR